MTIKTNNAGFVNFDKKDWGFAGDKGTWVKVSVKDGIETLTVKRAAKGTISREFEAEVQEFCEPFGIDFYAVGCGCTVSVEVVEEEKEEETATASKKYYHVAIWNGAALEPAVDFFQGEEEAIEKFLEKWPEAGVELAQYHVGMIHLFEDIKDAKEHAKAFGGDVLEINDPDDELNIEVDTLEYPHPVCRERIEAEFITIVSP